MLSLSDKATSWMLNYPLSSHRAHRSALGERGITVDAGEQENKDRVNLRDHPRCLNAAIACMDEPANPISEENVDLFRLDHRRYFAQAEGRVQHRLPFAISARPIIRCAVRRQGAFILRDLVPLECAPCAALRAAQS